MSSFQTPCTPSDVIIADDNAAWRDFASQVVRSMWQAEIHFANDGAAVETVLNKLHSAGTEPLLISDIHMDTTGDPTLNGDATLLRLNDGGKLPKFCFASGSHTDVRKMELIKATFGFRWLQKSAFLPTATQGEQTLLQDNLLAAWQAPPTLHLTTAQRESLQSITRKPLNVNALAILVDTLKPRMATIWEAHATTLHTISGATELFAMRNLLQGDVESNVHEFKNGLLLLQAQVQQIGAPESLTTALDIVNEYLSAEFYSAVTHQPVDAVVLIEELAAQFSNLSGVQAEFKQWDTEPLLLPADREKLRSVFSDLVQNAFENSAGKPVTFVRNDNKIVIENSGSIRFEVFENELFGILPTDSSGITRILERLDSLSNVLVSIDSTQAFNDQDNSDIVTTTICVQPQKLAADIDSTYRASKIHTKFPAVIFIDHNDQPRETFADLLQHQDGDETFHFLQTSRDLFYGTIEEGSKQQELVAEFLAEHHAVFSQASLLVAHISVYGLTAIFSEINRVYPHIVLAPTSHYPEQLNYDRQRDVFLRSKGDVSFLSANASKIIPVSDSVLTSALAKEYLDAGTVELVDELLLHARSVFMPENSWKLLRTVAHRHADAKAHLLEDSPDFIPAIVRYLKDQEHSLRAQQIEDAADWQREVEEGIAQKFLRKKRRPQRMSEPEQRALEKQQRQREQKERQLHERLERKGLELKYLYGKLYDWFGTLELSEHEPKAIFVEFFAQLSELEQDMCMRRKRDLLKEVHAYVEAVGCMLRLCESFSWERQNYDSDDTLHEGDTMRLEDKVALVSEWTYISKPLLSLLTPAIEKHLAQG